MCVFFLLPKFLTTELHASPSQVGLVNAVNGLAAALAVPILALTIDRGSPRGLIQVGAGVLALSALGYVWVTRVGPLILILRIAQGFAWAFLFTAGMVMATALSPKARMAQAIGYYGSANLVMNAVAPAVAETVAEHVGWKIVFVVAAATGALGFALARRLPAGERVKHERAAPKMWTLLRRPSSLWMMTIVVIWGSSFGAMFTFHQPFALGLGIRYVRGFFIAYTAAAILSRVATGSLADRIGRHRVSVASLTLYAAVVFGMQELRPGWLEWYGAIFGLAHGLFFPAYGALILERAPAAEHGKLMTLWNGAFSAGFAVSAALFGLVAEWSGYRQVFSIAGLSTLLAVVMLIFDPSRMLLEPRRENLRANHP